ncbi:MAG: GHKL domain-containing protein [Paramuribaculum sp.]|nr:GHKL domain-containing protein [Paramuribaculum sp.]
MRLKLYLLCIIVCACAATLLYIKEEWLIASSSALACGAFTLAVIKLFNRSDNDMTMLIEAVKNRDTSLRFGKNKRFGHIAPKLNQIAEMLHEARKRIAEEHKYYGMILSHVPVGVFVADEKGCVITVNSACLKLLGLSVLTSLARLDNITMGLTAKVESLANGDTMTFTVVNEEIMISCNRAITTTRGKIAIFVLTEIGGELDKKADATWSLSVRTLSHEIMNTIAPIISISQTLLSLPETDGASGEVKEGLETISESSSNLMAFAQNYRAIALNPKPVMHPAALADLIESAVNSSRHFDDGNQGKISFELSGLDKALIVSLDNTLTTHAITNVLKNAIEACLHTKSAHISVSLHRFAENTVALDISNNGPQISKNESSSIFDPFFTTKNHGQGIGLSLARRIMTSQGGSLHLLPYDNPESPTTFRFTFRLSALNP